MENKYLVMIFGKINETEVFEPDSKKTKSNGRIILPLKNKQQTFSINGICESQ